MIASAVLTAGSTLRGFGEIADRYDCVLMDVWGVLTGGNRAYAEAVACLDALARRAVPTVLVSNTSRRSCGLQRMLAQLGIGRAAYSDTVTAGDVAFDLVIRRDAALNGARRCIVVGNQPGGCWTHAAGLERTEDPRVADFVLAVGVLPAQWRQGECGETIDRALGHGLPFLITNPDRRVAIDGHLHDAVGMLTDVLLPLGGRVIETGKPHAAIFEAALRRVARVRGGVPKAAVMVGDSIETDVAGAVGCGIDAVLVGQEVADDAGAATWRIGALRW